MQATIRQQTKSFKPHRVEKARSPGERNGRVHVVSPATASEIRKTLRIGGTQIRNILRAFDAAGVKV